MQLYTGLIYEGVGLIGRINERLARAVTEAGATSLANLVGRQRDHWARQPVEV